jgi:hypothetical protein
MKKLVLLLCLLPQVLCSQINVHKAGNGWDSTVYAALKLIQQVSPIHYLLVLENVQTVEFWNEDYSSNNLINNNGVVVISRKDMELGSLNNIAAILIHESCHIKFLKANFILRGAEEEFRCYSVELKFLEMLPNVEPDLLNHVKEYKNFFNTQ